MFWLFAMYFFFQKTVNSSSFVYFLICQINVFFYKNLAFSWWCHFWMTPWNTSFMCIVVQSQWEENSIVVIFQFSQVLSDCKKVTVSTLLLLYKVLCKLFCIHISYVNYWSYNFRVANREYLMWVWFFNY